MKMESVFKSKTLIVLSLVLIYVLCFNFLPGDKPSFGILETKAAAITWDGGGAGDDWCTDANWSGDAEPTSSDTVTIDTNDMVTTSGCVTEGNPLDFSTLTIGGSNNPVVVISADIGTGGDITIASGGTLEQATLTTQTISGDLVVQRKESIMPHLLDFRLGTWEVGCCFS